MRQFLLFVLPVVTIVMVAVMAFAVIQTRIHDEKTNEEQKKRVRAVIESTEVMATHIFEGNNLLIAKRLTASFGRRERFQGYIMYDLNGDVIAMTQRIAPYEFDRNYIIDLLRTRSPFEHTERVGGKKFYGYAIPIVDDNNNVLGAVELIQEITKPQELQTAFWKRLSVFLIVLCSSLMILITLLQRRIFLQPVNKITDWFHSYMQGRTDQIQPEFSDEHLKKFASEVEQLALSLKVAKRSLSRDANSQLQKEEMWTEDKLKNLIHAKLGERSLFVVSNREPVMHKYEKTTMSVNTIIPAGGVVTAIRPILEACGGTWIAHGSGDQDRKFVNSKDKLGIPPEDAKYILKRVWLTKEEEEGYYYGFSNEGLWPLSHNTHTRPIFRENDWEMYKKVNRKFAQSIADELPANDPFVFIQDYHFTLLGRYIKDIRPDATIVLFWHIPWPTAEAFAICPYREEILNGLLGCDLLGFHLQQHCNNFLETVNRFVECRVASEDNSIHRLGTETFVRPFPISIDTSDIDKLDGEHLSTLQEVERIKKEFNLDDKMIGIGVDRIDYTKGILERFLAIERLLEKYPEYHKRFVFIQIGSPSRTHIKAYHDFTSEVDQTVERINWKFSQENWTPIIYLKKHFDGPDIIPFYTMADLCIVSSLHDGMNLVAKEYVAAKKDENGVLILSQFAGASKELTDALIVNPYSIEEFAGAIDQALKMSSAEKLQRMKNLRSVIRDNNVYKWAGNIISELINVSSKKSNAVSQDSTIQ